MAFPFPWCRPRRRLLGICRGWNWGFVIVKLRRLGCVGLRKVRRVMWLTKREWRPRAGQSASQNVNIHTHSCNRIRRCQRHYLKHHHHCQFLHHVRLHSKYSIPFVPLYARCTVVRSCARLVCAHYAILCGGGPAVGIAAILQRMICCLFATSSIPVVRRTYANL